MYSQKLQQRHNFSYTFRIKIATAHTYLSILIAISRRNSSLHIGIFFARSAAICEVTILTVSTSHLNVLSSGIRGSLTTILICDIMAILYHSPNECHRKCNYIQCTMTMTENSNLCLLPHSVPFKKIFAESSLISNNLRWGEGFLDLALGCVINKYINTCMYMYIYCYAAVKN